MLKLSTAQTDADFADVYSFWYDVYVTEMGRHINDTNTEHTQRKLYDPLATAGSLCLARKNGEVVGTVLSTPVDHPATQKYRTLYGLDSLSPEDQWTSAITTKLMVKANLRNTRLPLRLAFETFDWGLHVGIKHNYIDCNDHLVRLFSRLGYEPHLPSLYHKDYGQVNSMHLEITNEQRLRQVGSPFLAVLKRFQAEQGVIPRERPQPARSSHKPIQRKQAKQPARVAAPAA